MPLLPVEEIELMLLEAKQMEIKAEKNCDKILEELKKNGFYKAVKHIRNDERIHQTVVDKLISLLKKS